jgi:hypothetical protein
MNATTKQYRVLVDQSRCVTYHSDHLVVDHREDCQLGHHNGAGRQVPGASSAGREPGG